MLSGSSVHTSHYPSASEVFRVKKNFETTVFVVQYSVSCIALSY